MITALKIMFTTLLGGRGDMITALKIMFTTLLGGGGAGGG